MSSTRAFHLGWFPVFFLTITLACLSGCSPKHEEKPSVMTIFAASSLKEAVTAFDTAYSQAHPNWSFQTQFLGSQDLALQLTHGAVADVFLSADAVSMEAAVKSGRIDPATVAPFAHNHLVIIARNDGPVRTFSDLGAPGVRLAMAASVVPAGRYTLEMLDKADSLNAGFKERVLKNVVSQELNVRAAIGRVTLGELDATVGYVTDMNAVKKEAVHAISIPDDLNITTTCLAAPTKDGPAAAETGRWLETLRGETGQQILTGLGFLPIDKE